MPTRVRLLIVEDSEDDALLITRVLRRGDFEPEIVRVMTADDMRRALVEHEWDAIISDYSMPNFTGLDALKIAQEFDLDSPFFIVSGSIGEDLAVQAMKAGIADYVLKDNLARLPAALHRELRDAEMRRQRKSAISALTESEIRLELALRGGSLGLWDWNATTGDLTINERWARMLGYEKNELPPRIETFLDLLHSADRVRLADESRRVEVRANEYFQTEFRLRARDGTWRWVLGSGKVVERGPDGTPVRMAGTNLDITDHKRAEEALRESEERYSLAAQGANDGLWDWNLGSGRVYFAPRWKSMLGHTDGEVADTPEEWFGRVHPEDIAGVRRDLDAHLAGQSDHFQNEHRVRHADGTWRWVLCRGIAVRDGAGRAIRIAGSQTDIHDRRQAEEQLLYDAFHDHLTGLPNRALFLDRLERAFARARRHPDSRYSVLFIDLDRFKNVNDGLGHIAGDELLREMARRFSRCLRPADTLARFGGDEYVVLLEETDDPGVATRLAERLQQAAAEPIELCGREVITTASVGIVVSDAHYAEPQELIRDADTALFRAKGAGRNRYEVFDAEMHQRAMMMLELEHDLRRAIERDQLQLFYQPIVALATGQIISLEALLRWRHPTRGMVSPGDFIPLAEDTGLIVPIGEWVVRQACRQLRVWDEQFGEYAPWRISVNLSGSHFERRFVPAVNVNISPAQFAQRDIDQRVVEIANDEGVRPESLILEITESVFLAKPEAAGPMMHRLAEQGFSLHLDDFGTGFSSLSYLHQFPFHTLKIDRSFVSRMSHGERYLEMVKAIISLARSLDIRVTAEGVETEEQAFLLRDLGCDNGQGYFFSRPLPAEELEGALSGGHAWTG